MMHIGIFGAGLAAITPAAWAASDGAALYAQHCAVCHQADGAGAIGVAPSLTGEHWARLGADRNYLPTVMLRGLFGPIELAGGQTFNGNMPGLAPSLDDETVAAIASHVRKLQGASDSAPYRAEEIKALRPLPGSPTASRRMRAQLLGGG
jgi:mono/diheme cytochrome c family protein